MENQISLNIRWGCEADDPSNLANFFAQNVSTEYISHSEVQTGRANSLSEWSPKLTDVLRREISEGLQRTIAGSSNFLMVLIAEDSKRTLVGLGLVRFDGARQFATLEDLVIDSSRRGTNCGSQIFQWLLAAAWEQKTKRLFLESGISNVRAHSFFENKGFKVCSQVMVYELL